MGIIILYVDTCCAFPVNLSPWLVIFLTLSAIILLNICYGRTNGVFEIDQTEFGFGKQKVTIKPNSNDLQIAYKMWIELSTRKIGLSIDFEHDVIDEIYNSWYDFFSITRELLKEIPVTKIRRNSSTEEIVNLAIDVLNQGLRPHLTRWQARYRHWYKKEVERQPDKSPQEIQKQFPDYEPLKSDMCEVNQKLITYREKMKEMFTS